MSTVRTGPDGKAVMDARGTAEEMLGVAGLGGPDWDWRDLVGQALRSSYGGSRPGDDWTGGARLGGRDQECHGMASPAKAWQCGSGKHWRVGVGCGVG